MGDTAKSLISEFHTLPGETVKEKQKNLFNLLQKHRSILTTTEDLDFISSNLQSNNHLEKIFRTDVLIYFKQFSPLYEDFKKEDEITIKKLTKHDWFFERAFNEINCEEFVNVLLPTTSYSLKTKILKKLPVENERANDIFDAVCKRYGIFLATILLPKCTIHKIREVLKTYPINFTIAQLKIVYKKSPDLIHVYFEEKYNCEGKQIFYHMNSFLQYIAQKNPEMFSKLFDEYDFEICLGRRTTKRFIDSQKNTISENTEDYLKCLNKSVAVRKFGSEIKDLLFKNNLNKNQLYWKSVIQFYPENQRSKIFESAYNNSYHYKLGEDVDAVSEDILKIMDNAEQRERLAKLKMEKTGNVTFLQYFTSQQCIQEVRGKLNNLPVNDRSKYIEFAASCCFLNKDYPSFIKICELVAVRLKNDDAVIRRGFLNTLNNKNKKLKHLDESHWKFIVDIMVTAKVNKEWFSGEATILSEYIKYLTKNNKSLKDLIYKDFQWINIAICSKIKEDPKAHCLLLEEMIATGLTKQYPIEAKIFEKRSAIFDCTLLQLCEFYNKQNPGNLITTVFDNPRIQNSIQFILNQIDPKGTEYDLRGLRYFICRPLEKLQELKMLYFKNYKEFGCVAGLMWFLKHEPKTIQDNFEQFLSNFGGVRGLNPRKQWRFIKKCTHLELDKRTIEFCKQKLLEDRYEYKIGLVRALTMLDTPDAHLEFIKPFVPTTDKVDLTDIEVKEKYLLQSEIVKLLYYLQSPSDVLDATFDFCKGDYLKPALASLYSCMYRLPENETKIFIQKLDNIKAVSVKKHAVHLSCLIYSVKDVYKQLTNATVPVQIPLTKFFAKNPSNNLWQILELQINNLEKNELQVFKEAFKIHIPSNYKGKYVEIVWNILNKYENTELKKIFYKKIDKKTVRKLNHEFALEVIKNNIFKTEEVNEVIANIVIYLNTDEKFALLSETLTKFKKSCWNDPKVQKIAHKRLNSFILTLYKIYIQDEDEGYDEKFVSELTIVFRAVFSISEAIEEFVVIKCMNLHEEELDRSTTTLLDTNNVLNEEFGLLAVHILAETLFKHIFKHKNVFLNEWDRMEFCYSLFKSKKSVNDSLLILYLLPKNEPKDKEHFKFYEEILGSISQISDKIVQLQYNLCLKSGANKLIELNF